MNYQQYYNEVALLLLQYNLWYFIQAKGKERQWQRHQTMGELDDMKLIEGLTGERNVYKRRAEQEPEVSSNYRIYFD